MIRHPNIEPPPPMSRDIFAMGVCVRVDPSTTNQGGIGFVFAVHTEERKVDIDYIENSLVLSIPLLLLLKQDFILMSMLHLIILVSIEVYKGVDIWLCDTVKNGVSVQCHIR